MRKKKSSTGTPKQTEAADEDDENSTDWTVQLHTSDPRLMDEEKTTRNTSNTPQPTASHNNNNNTLHRWRRRRYETYERECEIIGYGAHIPRPVVPVVNCNDVCVKLSNGLQTIWKATSSLVLNRTEIRSRCGGARLFRKNSPRTQCRHRENKAQKLTTTKWTNWNNSNENKTETKNLKLKRKKKATKRKSINRILF